MTHAQRPVFWRGHINRWHASGLSQTQYCAKHGISETALAKWRKRLSDGPITHRRRNAAFVPVVVAGAKKPALSQVEGSLPENVSQATATPPIARAKLPDSAASRRSSSLEIVVRGGRTIRVPSDFDEAALTRIIQLLERLPFDGAHDQPC